MLANEQFTEIINAARIALATVIPAITRNQHFVASSVKVSSIRLSWTKLRIPMVGSAIARYKVESKGATYYNLGESAGNEWRRSLCTLQRFLALVEAYCHMLIDGGTVSRVRRSQGSVTGSW
jgi:hypothetical protein